MVNFDTPSPARILLATVSLAPLLPAFLVAIACRWLTRRREERCRPRRRRLAILLLTTLALLYLGWRCLFGLNQQSPPALALSLLLLACEGWLILTGLIQVVLSCLPRRNVCAAANRGEVLLAQCAAPPTVDVLVPCCGEPLAILERTLNACSRLDYPAFHVWLLDDGPDTPHTTDTEGCGSVSQRAALAASLDVRYRRRPLHQQAKAGNLNAALPHCRGELVAVFDADVVPQPHFLRRTVGLFLEQSRLGFVQTPQSYMTPDPLMRNLAMEDWLLHDEESFYRWIEPVRDSVNAVVCAGTSFVMRRCAIDQVGGFTSDCLSEDLATGIRVIAEGWLSAYLPEKLSAGLAPAGVRDFARQRLRWCRGTLQTLRSPKGPLRIPGLSARQRLAFMEGILHWFNAIPRLMLLLMPLTTGLWGILPINLSGSNFLLVFLPYWTALLMLVGWLNRGSRSALLPELYSWLLTPALAWTVVQTLLAPRWRSRFHVTPKFVLPGRQRFAWSLAVPLVVLLVLNGWNLVGLLEVLPPNPNLVALRQGGEGNRLVGLLWSGLNMVGLLTAISACLDPPQSEPRPTFRVAWSAHVATADGDRSHAVSICHINEQSLCLQPPLSAADGNCRLSIGAPAGAGCPSPTLPIQSLPQPGHYRIAWPDSAAASAERLRWLQWLYATPGRWCNPTAPVEWRALTALALRMLRLRRPANRGFRLPAPAEEALTPGLRGG